MQRKYFSAAGTPSCDLRVASLPAEAMEKYIHYLLSALEFPQESWAGWQCRVPNFQTIKLHCDQCNSRMYLILSKHLQTVMNWDAALLSALLWLICSPRQYLRGTEITETF